MEWRFGYLTVEVLGALLHFGSSDTHYTGDMPKGDCMFAPRFRLGQIVGTPGVLDALEYAEQVPEEFITRHVTGDWGDLDEEDKAANEATLRYGGRLFSAYHLSTNVKIYIITEADRSTTTLLLPEEY
jgi:hypothetical protein